MSVEWDRASEYWTKEERLTACEDCCKGICTVHGNHKKEYNKCNKSNSSSLKDYWVSDAHWDGDELEVTLSPVSRPKYVVRVSDQESAKELLNIMSDRHTPVRDFNVSDNTLEVNNIVIKVKSIENKGK